MTVIVRCAFEGGLFPQDFAGLSIQAQNFELMFVIGADAVWMDVLFAFVDVLHCGGSRNYWPFDGRRQKDPVTPNYWRRVTSALDGCLPLDVLRRTPVRREVLLARNAQSRWATPLRPICSTRTCRCGEDH